MKYAYIRVSSDLQTTQNQKLLIEKSGFIADGWFSEDGVSGTILALDRPAFKQMMSQVKEGDEVCVSALDRLGRNAADILKTVETFIERKVKLRIHAMDNLDVTSIHGKMFIGILAVLAEMDRNQIVERITSGLARTQKEGMILGKALTITPDTLKNIKNDRDTGFTLDQLQTKYSIPRNTIHRNLKSWGDNLEGYAEAYNSRIEQDKRQRAKKIEALGGKL